MIFEASSFVFEPPKEVAFARRVLIKPSAGYPHPHPMTTSRETLAAVIEGIRRVSAADILLIEKSTGPEAVHSIFQTLEYDFPRTILLDVDQCVPVAVENTLPRPFTQSTFWVPNVILSCDFLITIAPFRVISGGSDFSIKNLLGLLPTAKYRSEIKRLAGVEQHININNMIADLYFTLPFDLGIVDGRKKLNSSSDSISGDVTEYGKIFVGTPYEVDSEASQAAGVVTEYLGLIEKAKIEQGGSS